jgi:hypothetical protein
MLQKVMCRSPHSFMFIYPIYSLIRTHRLSLTTVDVDRVTDLFVAKADLTQGSTTHHIPGRNATDGFGLTPRFPVTEICLY